MAVRKTSVESSEELLAAVRREEIEALSTLRGMNFADPEEMAKAWRP